MSATRIEARDCARTFNDGTKALLPCNLVVEAGETVVLLGPSGCGKTTLLRILSGLDKPDSGGQVFFAGQDVTQLPIEKRKVGMVFQNYALFPNMNVLENVGYAPRLKGAGPSERTRITSRYLGLCRIEHLAKRRIDQLSGGQRQRVALARALAAEPRAIFLDEPLTALDATLRDTLRDEISHVLVELGITAVYVTHDQIEAMALADKLVVMSEGRIEQIGTPATVYGQPANHFVATFVGETNALPEDSETLFRPESVTVCEPSAPEARVVQVISATYLGSSKRLLLDLDGQTLIAYVTGGHQARPGDTLGIQIDSEGFMRWEKE